MSKKEDTNNYQLYELDKETLRYELKTTTRRAMIEKAIDEGVDISGTILDGVNFSRMNLVGVDFSGCYLRLADFRDANLFGASFNGADISAASFDRAILFGADFSHTDIDLKEFKGADITSVKTTSCAYKNDKRFEVADIAGEPMFERQAPSKKKRLDKVLINDNSN